MNPEDTDNDTIYRVRLNTVVMRGHRQYLPRDRHRFKGAVIKEIAAKDGAGVFDAIQPA